MLIHHDTTNTGNFHRTGYLILHHLAGATIQVAGATIQVATLVCFKRMAIRRCVSYWLVSVLGPDHQDKAVN